MKRMIRSREHRMTGVVSWNNYFYGYDPVDKVYYKSRTVRFDDSMGGVQAVPYEVYKSVSEKYNSMFGGQ